MIPSSAVPQEFLSTLWVCHLSCHYTDFILSAPSFPAPVWYFHEGDWRGFYGIMIFILCDSRTTKVMDRFHEICVRESTAAWNNQLDFRVGPKLWFYTFFLIFAAMSIAETTENFQHYWCQHRTCWVVFECEVTMTFTWLKASRMESSKKYWFCILSLSVYFCILTKGDITQQLIDIRAVWWWAINICINCRCFYLFNINILFIAKRKKH